MPARPLLRWLLIAALWPTCALAQQVVVLEFPGDPRGAVRAQLVEALQQAGAVELVPVRRFEQLAERQGFRGRRATSDAAIAAVAPRLELEAVVAGEVKGRLYLRILDATGAEVWAKDLPLLRGRLSEENARRLANAIGVAAKPPAPSPDAPPAPTDGGTPPPDTAPPADGTAGAQAPPPDIAAPVEAVTPPTSPPAAPARAQPPLVTATLTGTSTWRGYCTRPGANLSNCQQYDDIPPGPDRPPGPTVTYSSPVPHTGYLISADVFPAAGLGAWWSGFGLSGTWAQAFALPRVTITTDTGQTEPRTVLAIDSAWSATLVYRHSFQAGAERLAGYAGARAGWRTRRFNVEEQGTAISGGPDRRFASFGLEGAYPLAKLARVEAEASFSLDPRPGTGELTRYGTAVRSLGFAATLGLSGDVWGPLGYVFRFQFEGYADGYTGAGGWWAVGGVAQEFYASLHWGLRARY